MFRPDDQFTHACSTVQPTLEVSTGPLITEIKQTFSDYASHTIRLTKGSPYVEVSAATIYGHHVMLCAIIFADIFLTRCAVGGMDSWSHPVEPRRKGQAGKGIGSQILERSRECRHLLH